MEDDEIIKHDLNIDDLSISEIEELIIDYKNKIKDLEKKIVTKNQEKLKAEDIFKK